MGVQSALGRMEARAVLRLLLRADNMTAVLFRDEIYYSSQRDDALESQASFVLQVALDERRDRMCSKV